MFDPPSNSNDKEQELEQRLNGFKKEIEEDLMKQVNNAISGAVRRVLGTEMPEMIKKNVETSIAGQLEAFRQEFNPSLIEENIKTAFDGILTQINSESSNETDSASIEFRRQQQETQKMIESLKKELEQQKQRADAEAKARQEISEQQRIQAMRNNALGKIRDKVRNPEQLLTLLEASGAMTDKDGQYYVRSKGEYGLEEDTPLEKAIAALLQTPEYEHYGDIRPGTGTGATPSGNATAARGKYINPAQDTSVEAIYSITQDPAKYQELLKEASAAIRGGK